MKYCVSFLLLLLLAGCGANAPTATPVPPTPAPTYTLIPPTVTAVPAPRPTLLPALLDATLPRLAEHSFQAGEIQTTEVLTAKNAVTTSLVTYTSEGLKITGLLNEPSGDGRFPAIVLVHGYIEPAYYNRGLDAQEFALDLARHGYITFVPDLRGYKESEHGINLFLSGFIADVVNAGIALKKYPRVDAEHVGLWGHSMGAGLASRAMVVNQEFDAVVLYAPLSADNQEMVIDPLGGESQGLSQELVESIITVVDNPEFNAQVSPKNYWDRVNAPVSIHVGSADTVTPPAWAQAIRDGLTHAGKQVEYFEYAGQGHSFQGDAVPQFSTRVLDFFDRYLK